MGDELRRVHESLDVLQQALDEFIETALKSEHEEAWKSFLPQPLPMPVEAQLDFIVRNAYNEYIQSTLGADGDVGIQVCRRLHELLQHHPTRGDLSARQQKRVIANVEFLLSETRSYDSLARYHSLKLRGPSDSPTAARERASATAVPDRAPSKRLHVPQQPAVGSKSAKGRRAARSAAAPSVGASSKSTTVDNDIEMNDLGAKEVTATGDKSMLAEVGARAINRRSNQRMVVDLSVAGEPIMYESQENSAPGMSDGPSAHSGIRGAYSNAGNVSHGVSFEDASMPRKDLASLLFVVDGPNVAYRHGVGTFSPKGILYSHNFFARNGSSCVVVVPEGKLSVDMLRASDSDMVADSNEVTLELRELLKKGRILLTPSEDYDDSYVLHYAMSRGGIAVSNDRFNDHLHQAAARGPEYHSILAEFLKHCRLCYAFREDEFIPSPDFDIKNAALHAKSVAERLARENRSWGFPSR
mmetsp:Transcript_7654/g.23180  ORF Transcript_7654/g.23180 Transcript_7654/m.23180 type:complete len:471 (+) Transcript_7654:147-1559(+)